MDYSSNYVGVRTWSLNTSRLYPDKEFKLDWTKLLHPTLGCEEERRNLTLSAQNFFLANWGERTDQAWCLSPNAMRVAFEMLGSICRWMTARQLWNFSDLLIEDVLEFFKSRRPRSASGKAISQKHFHNLYTLFQLLWDSRARYERPIRFNIGAHFEELKLFVRTRQDRPWVGIDEKKAIQLIGQAINWLEHYGPSYLRLIRSDRECGTVNGRSYGTRNKALVGLYREAEKSDLYLGLKAELKLRDSRSIKKVLTAGFTVLEGACAYLVLILSGMRVSELLSLNVNCTEYVEQEPGEVQTFICGIAAKRNGEERKWVAGKMLVKVVEFLKEVASIATTDGYKEGSDRPLLLLRQSGAFFPEESCAIRWSQKSLRSKLRKFVSSQYRKGDVYIDKFHPHMTRKSFAQLAVLRNKSMLGPVAAQFGHAYKQFTDDRYVGSDHELSRMLAIADRKELAIRLRHLLECANIGGAAAPTIQKIRNDVSSFKGKNALKSLVDKLIGQGVMLAPCDWGYCIYSKVYSACGGDQTGPNEVARSPGVCSSCKNFVATVEHRPWWEERVKREERFILNPQVSEQAKILAKERLKKSHQVLATLIVKLSTDAT
ncbi:site-specific integrase [Herbaspirillum lusitanum]|uniref:tyrosine-type recombinase/integrase n=1 Tax=Herbaspirillum lusitanum TaxID=213312 RepID=UPI002238A040|nr:tyrosine-type recombinase/integrase [Herbaspirillum lusitanum]MCW5297286.1 site-specific integrase [Herbaspirillum lusitanum]